MTSSRRHPNDLFRAARLRLKSAHGDGPMSREELADLVNDVMDPRDHDGPVSASDIGKIERGIVSWPRKCRRQAYRTILNVRTDAEIGLMNRRIRPTDQMHSTQPLQAIRSRTEGDDTLASPHPAPIDDQRECGEALAAGASLELPAAGLIAIRAALDTADLPPDGPLRPVADLTADVAGVTRLRLASNYMRLCAVLSDLLDDLHRAYSFWQGQRRVVVAALLAQTYRAADALADKSGRYDLSARLIGMMTEAARQSGNEVVLATASYVRGELFFANGRPDLGRTLLERAAERLDPDTDAASSAAYGSLHMRAGVLAGQARQLEHARDHLAEAAQWATRVTEGEYNGTAFGPSSVRIHEVTLAVDTNDPDTALRVSRDWDPSEKLSAERRSHFYIDVARAQAQLDKVNAAVIALFQARAVAPEHTRFHPQVREVVTRLLDKRAVTPQVLEFARWTRISAEIS
ncbi:hypothetical protein GCM10010172_30870 [Paractinoplanes ferrugineus]|uniref:Uncharacterized protein n=1 Tax=Paractinoplanes ferrugineus TaxID=113564 RepID=A0A919MC15_9ACTN|nr:hypothetical protein [Actinoplanes ferrugineus]GIE14221.1 hypothetical protein Afe05nite_60610 [Actinoplanes ferrugineus]